MNRFIAAFTLVPFALIPAHAVQLLSPWDGQPVAATDAPYACPNPPEFAKRQAAESYYTDAHRSIVDAAKKAAYDKASESLTHLGQFAGLAADAYLYKGSKPAAACVYSLLDAAAKADAWTGQPESNQEAYDQNWLLSGTAIPYLKVRNSGMGTRREDRQIQAWLGRLAQQVRAYFDSGKRYPQSDAYNNHVYWAGLAVAAEGIAGNDQDAFLWGIENYYQGVKSIQPDGSLLAEMNRAGRALHYQLYALGPLIMLAELGAANGLDLYSAENGAIHRLVRFDLAAMEDPNIIVQRTGVPQDVVKPLTGLQIGWAVSYTRRFPNAQLAGLIAQAPSVRFWQWGGAPPQPELHRPAPSRQRAAFEAALKRRVNDAIAAHSSSLFTAFLGEWCGQGIPGNRASIAANGLVLSLTNENGDASIGRISGSRKIVAPGWQNVRGTLTPNGSQIDWTNGTYWDRCLAATAIAAPVHLDLEGGWFQQSDFSHPCSIRRQGDLLQFHCRRLGSASGKFVDATHLILKYKGHSVSGTVTDDGNHIDWDYQTYWTRSTVYQPSKQ